MTVKHEALSIFDVNDVFSLIFESRHSLLEDGVVLKSNIEGIKTRLSVFDQKGSIIVEGSIGNSTILMAHTEGKWLLYMNLNPNVLPVWASRKQRLQYFMGVLKDQRTIMRACESDDFNAYVETIGMFAKEAR